ncbi:MAG TPA: hypothetical protein VK781_14675 [Solirubrobacteraceae bacterium]|jgi:hypothetical protein|nr:hypothetical protein [Solirubrobacteraceae bacterium]
MRASHVLSLRGLNRASRFVLPAFAAAATLALPALASGAQAPEYSLSIVEGANTQPEDSIQHVSASASHPRAEVVVSIAHNGLVVEQDKGDGGAWLSQVPQVGDVVTLESPVGVARGAVVYDGLPSLDPTVCAGSINFSGQRSAGETIEGGYYTVVPHPSYFARRGGGLAQVQALTGPSFQGGFLAPLLGGETVYAVESLISPLAGGATFAYSSENDRPVGACPVPPSPPPPPPPLALAGSFAKFARTTIHKLLRSGWSTHVRINQPGRVVEDLYQHEGTLPAFAATSKHKRRRKPPAVLLARGTATAKTAGTVTVTMHATSKGRRLLKHAHSIKTVLVTTLNTASGAKLTLERHSVTLHS